MKREKFSSRIGFILISAGCAIGLGNVYRFPIITGAYGGAAFVAIYLLFLLILGIPIMTAELAVGRGSQRSIASSFAALQRPGQHWGFMKYLGIGGNYLLMMFYTTITSWVALYCLKYVNGSILDAGTTVRELGIVFNEMAANVPVMLVTVVVVILLCFGICSLGLKNGVERISKIMMVALLLLMLCLAVYCCTLSGAAEGLKFYLIPSFDSIRQAGIGTVISAAMGQAFFTLGLGIGSIAIFGSYIDKDRSLLGEAFTITGLDTFVALISGLIVFPACFTYQGGVYADAGTVGANFLFTTLSSIFNSMPAGQLLGSVFFLCMIFASLSTVIAVFENIIAFWMELTKLSRPKIAGINIVLVTLLSLPCLFSTNIWSEVTVFDMGFMDLEDFTVSHLLTPIGSLGYILFCTSRYGWGWENYYAEVNTGKGLNVAKWMRPYLSYVLPLIILLVMVLSML